MQTLPRVAYKTQPEGGRVEHGNMQHYEKEVAFLGVSHSVMPTLVCSMLSVISLAMCHQAS